MLRTVMRSSGYLDLARTTPPTLVSDTEVHDEVDRFRGVPKESRQLDVSTPLTSAARHLRGLDLGGCVEEVRELVRHERS